MPEPPRLTEEQKEHQEEEERRKGSWVTGVVACRNNQIALRWQISALLGAINSAVIPFWATQIHNPWVRFWTAIFAVFANTLWLFLNKKSQLWIDFWNSALARMEPPETEAGKFRVFSGLEWKEVSKFPAFHFYMNLIASGFMVAWFFLAFVQFSFPERR